MELTNLLVTADFKLTEFGNICVTDDKFSEDSSDNIVVNCHDAVAYPGLINIHDHLADNWLPRIGADRPYKNKSEWIKELRESESLLERKEVWQPEDYSDLTENNAMELALLGMYKNIFSGVVIIMDHVPLQKKAYYDNFFINVISDYQQGHSVSLKNWWGGKSLESEYEQTDGNYPFVIHVAEGSDSTTKNEFDTLRELGLLKKNVLMAQATNLTDKELEEVAEVGASIAWSPASNNFLLEKSFNYQRAKQLGINICLGTDSTLSGSLNILDEIRFVRENYPEISKREIFKMVTENPAKALMLKDYNGKIEADKQANLLITKKKSDDPFENLLKVNTEDIELLLYRGIPITGLVEYLKFFSWDAKQYYLFEYQNAKRFVVGHPERILDKINDILGYKKIFDYLPF
ncbi:MAG: amidohydrolase family protein [Candidatus Cloacimonetes bacterium]|nr:amidohydrolase family protein [Candidatus Cloacimonadota bacterium]